jgi:hypothetical protein
MHSNIIKKMGPAPPNPYVGVAIIIFIGGMLIFQKLN